MRARILQHVPFEGPAHVGRWLAERGADTATIHGYRGDALPDPSEFDLLVVLGGPMSVNDVDRYPWLAEEQALILDTIEAGRAILGICLGAQLIARALGAEVGPASEREIGWFDVRRDPESDPDNRFGLPDRFPALHWHGEECELPPGCVRLASTDVCANQMFCLGAKVLAIQFHLEFEMASVRDLAINCPSDLAPGAFVQPEARILADAARFADAHRMMDSLLGQLTNTVVAATA